MEEEVVDVNSMGAGYLGDFDEVTPDGKHYLLTEKRGLSDYDVSFDGKRVHLEGCRGPARGAIYSEMSERYAAVVGCGLNLSAVVLEGHVNKHIYVEEHSLKFSSNGAHSAYLAKESGSYVLVLDGVAKVRVPELAHVKDLVLSPTGAHSAFIEWGKDYARVVYDGVLQKRYQDVYELTLSANDRDYGYWAEVTEGKFCLVWNGKEGELLDDIGGLTISGDGAHMAYVATRNGGRFAVRDGTPELEDRHFENVEDLTFSADGRHLAYTAEQHNKRTVVLDGVLWQMFNVPGVQPMNAATPLLTFSQDGVHLAAIMSKGKTAVVVLDRKEGQAWLLIPTPQAGAVKFSPNGRRLAYIATDTKDAEHLIVDGLASAGYKGISDVTFSSDSNHVAYLVDRSGGGSGVVVDGKEFPSDGFVAPKSFSFSPDGTHFSYWTYDDELKGANLVLDGKNLKTIVGSFRGSIQSDWRLGTFGCYVSRREPNKTYDLADGLPYIKRIVKVTVTAIKN